MGKSALFIVNPTAGKLKNQPELIKEICQMAADYDITVYNSTGKEDEKMIGELLKNQNHDLVMVGGGDGTIGMVASQVINFNIPLLPIPFGSANGLSTCLGIREWEDSIQALIAGDIIQMDVLDVNGEFCFHLCDFGFNAGLIKKFEERDERGMGAYFKSSLAQVFENNQFLFHLEFNGEKTIVKAKMLVVANGEMYGTGAMINPTGKKDDGRFEIIALNPDNFKEWMLLTMGFIKEDFDGLDFIQTMTVDHVIIENIDGADFHIDGEMKMQSDRVEIQMKKEKIGFYTNISKLD
ncbi:MAG: diacylglycerol kinase family protein [Cyclobacteriaceae bacterium]